MRWAHLVARGPVLDLACGSGRHARFFAERGLEVVAVDRDPRVFDSPRIRFVQADLEGGRPWPFGGVEFGGIVVANYLHRPLFAHLAGGLAPGGALIYETFMTGNERYGRPSNPEFLLRPGELLAAFASLEARSYEEGFVERPKRAVVQRLCAIRGRKG